jgi:hypothetical protein
MNNLRMVKNNTETFFNSKKSSPRQALNKAFLKVKPIRNEIERFKANLVLLLDSVNETESEEFHKNLVADFLKTTYYHPNHFINTKGRNDLVIHNGNKANTAVGVIVETKKPTNKAEMLKLPTADDSPAQIMAKLNVKALHELVLYYLRERITHKNLEVKYLIATNINEWFVFDATLFDRLFAQNRNLVKQFHDFEEGRLADTKTEFFYKHIAGEYISTVVHEMEFTYFDIREFEKPLRNLDRKDDNKLISLFKLLSPNHLLKLPFANDSNTLDKHFYSELLYIIGLTETKKGGRKLIERNTEGERNSGSLIENAILQLDSLDIISNLQRPEKYGTNKQERLFNLALELSITWINRILFLKLLEAQLVSYHNGDKTHEFLNYRKLKNYDALNKLFFQVLAKQHHERGDLVNKTFEKVPYLNSSLFEPSEIERQALFISNLDDELPIPIYSATVLKDPKGNKRAGEINPLEYLFAFLDAYDFAGEGAEEVQEENKTLINASVLGLIFEKINGYKDGSFFTPGFITMYMCRKTIRRAVIQKFNEVKGWNCKDIESLYDKIDDRHEANEIVNSMKICDPAVGSGHFLVSALNELIAIKNDLKILQDRHGRRLKEYDAVVENDELIITDENGELFRYNPTNKESQRVQETLFHEKQTIIENCLFGVDINPNSVKICHLRLWIELLKNAYYMQDSNSVQTLHANPVQTLHATSPRKNSELQTLPNIDINIKCGNSLLSRFSLSDNHSSMPPAVQQKLRLATQKYKDQVIIYKSTNDKTTKQKAEKEIAQLKEQFAQISNPNDADFKKLKEKRAQMGLTPLLFNREEQDVWKQKVEQLAIEVAELEEIYNEKVKTLYGNTLEWRFAFPEVLDDNGNFVGFDVVIGNPPYIRQEELKDLKSTYKENFKLYSGTADIYVYFIEKGFEILKNKGLFTYIMPNKFMQAGYGQPARKFLLENRLLEIIDFGDYQVFDEATTYPCILQASKERVAEVLHITKISTNDFAKNFNQYVYAHRATTKQTVFTSDTWMIGGAQEQELLQKLVSSGVKLDTYLGQMGKYGIKTGLTEAFLIDEDTKKQIIEKDPNSERLIKPFLLGRDVKPYLTGKNKNWLILMPKGFTIKRNLPPDSPHFVSEAMPRYGYIEYDEAWQWFQSNYPGVAEHLLKYKEKAMARTDKGDYWWELRACDYYDRFEQPKILYQVFQVKPCFIYDTKGMFCNNSMWFIPSNDKVLLGILNSKVGWWLISKYCTAIQNGFQLIWKYFSQIPIANGNVDVRQRIEALVDEILSTKEQNLLADTTALENKIDLEVYRLYNLSAQEIEVIEKNS